MIKKSAILDIHLGIYNPILHLGVTSINLITSLNSVINLSNNTFTVLLT